MTSSSPRRPKPPASSPPRPQSSLNPSASAATFSPRRPVGSRDGTTNSRLATSLALATQDTLLAATPSTAAGINTSGGNPHVQAIQSRVAELVRRYDESVANAADRDDDDDEGSDALAVPTRWRVGDMLLATHAALAKTSTRVERTMQTEFAEDDAEVEAALGGEGFAEVIHVASRTAAQTKAMLAKSLQVVQQLQHSQLQQLHALDPSEAGRATQLRDLKITVEVLHKEKSMVLAQLHEHTKSQKEMVALLEEQNQELKKSQIAVAMKNEELKNTREDFTIRLNDLQKMNETSQQNATTWHDKFQATLKTLGDVEAKAAELETKSQGQGEEVVKHEFVLRTKNAELEKLKERLKASEATRFKAEAALKEAGTEAAAMAKCLEAAQAAVNKANMASAPSTQPSSHRNSKAMQEMEAKVRRQECTIADLQARLNELTHSRSKFEEDNNELARIVRELQARAQEVLNSRPPAVASSMPKSPPPVVQRSTSFALSLKREPWSRRGHRRSSVGDTANLRRQIDDDLSTSSSEDEDDPETVADERELNAAVQEVVTVVFPARVSPLAQHSDEAISDSIALVEAEPTTHRPLTAEPTEAAISTESSSLGETRPITATSVVSPRESSDTACSSGVDVDQLRAAHTQEIARLKKHYVTTLLEYKALVIEQYERRQHEIQQHHKLEIENLILLVQAKFKRELERRGECMMQAKESLKLLYRAMQAGVPGGTATDDGDDPNADVQSNSHEPPDEPVPLKSILRAAVFAMSSSKQRNQKALDAINDIYGDVRSKQSSPRKPVVNVRVKGDKTGASRSPELAAPASEPSKGDTDWAAFLKSMRANRDESARSKAKNKSAPVHVGCQVDDRDFIIYDLKGLRSSHVLPENMEHYVVPSTGLFASTGPTDPSTVASHAGPAMMRRPPVDRGDTVFLNSGALLDESVVAELRSVLPFLPPGSYYLSSSLRHQLLLEMMRFYADLGRQQQQNPQHSRHEREALEDTVEITIGSPRDTPFLRRKAVEMVDRQQRRRRGESLSNSAMAMLQPPQPQWTAKKAHGFVSH